MKLPYSKSQNLSFQDIKLLSVVTRRVANDELDAIIDGDPKTDGKSVWLPLSNSEFDFNDLIGIAAHEGSHIRFKSLFDLKSDFRKKICPENLILASVVANFFEDARVDFLLNLTFPGFWKNLDKLNSQMAKKSVKRLEQMEKNIIKTKYAADFAFAIAGLYKVNRVDLLNKKSMKNEDGTFKFACEEFKNFWKAVLDAFNYLYKFLTFSATIVASKMFIEALSQLICLKHEEHEKNDSKSDLNNEKSKENTDEVEEKQNNESKTKKDSKSIYGISLSELIVKEKKNKSGILDYQLTKTEKKRMQKIFGFFEKNNNTSEIQNFMQKDMEIGRKEIFNEIECIKSKKKGKTTVNIEYIYEDNQEIVVKIYDNKADLKRLNHQSNPEFIYDAVIQENRDLISSLRRDLKKIKQKPNYERGARRGLVSHRDLVRVVSSKGKFDRPFKIPHRKVGVKLLIVIDESSSMLRDYDHFEEEFYDYDYIEDCPFKDSCKNVKNCPLLDEDESYLEEYKGDKFKGECKLRRINLEELQDCIPIFIAKKTAIIIAEALNGTRINFCVVGFSAVEGKMNVIEKVYKKFEETINKEKLGSIWASMECTENRDGTSFDTIASRYFKNIQGDIPIMIVISDGIPWHSGTSYIESEARNSTAKAVKILKSRGIKMFALSIDTEGNHYLKNIYGENNYLIVQNPADITQKLIYLVRNIAKVIG